MPSLHDTPPPTPLRAPGLDGDGFEFVRKWLRTDDSRFPELWEGLDAIFEPRSSWASWPAVEKICNDASENPELVTTALLDLDDLEDDLAHHVAAAEVPAKASTSSSPIAPQIPKSPDGPASRPAADNHPSDDSAPAPLPFAVPRGSSAIWVAPDGGIFSSPNMVEWPQGVPPEGPVELDVAGERWSELTQSSAGVPVIQPVENPTNIRWARRREPWLPLVAAEDIPEIGVFKSLAFPEHAETLLVRDSDGFKARRARDWIALERKLLLVADILYTGFVATWAISACLKWNESSLRGWWNRPQANEATALRATRLVYYTLLKLCAVVSLYCAIGAHMNMPPDAWCDMVTSNDMDSAEDRQWLAGLKTSFVTRFQGVRRAGVFVDVHKFSTPKLLEVYLAANVPLYLYWGPDRVAIPTLLDGNTAFDHLRPLPVELDAAGVPHATANSTVPPPANTELLGDRLSSSCVPPVLGKATKPADAAAPAARLPMAGEKRRRVETTSPTAAELEDQRKSCAFHEHWITRFAKMEADEEANPKLQKSRRLALKWQLTTQDSVYRWSGRIAVAVPQNLRAEALAAHPPWDTRFDPGPRRWDLFEAGTLLPPSWVHRPDTTFAVYREGFHPWYIRSDKEMLCTPTPPPTAEPPRNRPRTGSAAPSVNVPAAVPPLADAPPLCSDVLPAVLAPPQSVAAPASTALVARPVQPLPPVAADNASALLDWQREPLIDASGATMRYGSLADHLLRMGYRPRADEVQASTRLTPALFSTQRNARRHLQDGAVWVGLPRTLDHEVPRTRNDTTTLEAILLAFGISTPGLITSRGQDHANFAVLQARQAQQLALSEYNLRELFDFVARLKNSGKNVGVSKSLLANKNTHDLLVRERNFGKDMQANTAEYRRLQSQLISAPLDLPASDGWYFSSANAASTWQMVARRNVWLVSEGVVVVGSGQDNVWFLQLVQGPDRRRVVLFDSTVVAQVLLSGRFQTIKDLLIYCVENGIRVHSPEEAAPVDEADLARLREDRLRVLAAWKLGSHAPDYIFTPEDAEMSDARRLEIFNDRAIRRAVVMSGGFSWRVASVHSYSDYVLDGPSHDARVLRIGVHFRLGQGRTAIDLYDDALTPEVEHFILGGWYSNSEPNSTYTPSLLSYWPPNALWNSFSSPGWDTRKEEIYQHFCRGYADPANTFQPVNASRWKQLLRGRDDTARQVAAGAEWHARAFLATRAAHVYA